MRIPFKDRPEAIATSHHPDPGQNRVCAHKVDPMESENILLVQDVPNPRRTPEALGRDMIKQIVHGDNCDAHRRNNAHWKIDQPGKPDHGNPNRPKDDKDHRMRREAYLRKKDQPQYRDLKDNQPNTTTNQQPRQFALRVMAAGHPEICAQAGCKHENRRAKMRDPSGKKDSWSRARQVSRQELLRTPGHVVANMIDRHQHHDGPAQSIHRLNARRRYRLSGNRRRSHDFAILFFMPTSDCRFLKQPPPVGGRIQQHCTRRVSLRWRRTRTRTAVTGHVFGYSEAMVGQLLTSRVTRQLPLTPWGKSTSPVSTLIRA